MKGLLYIIPADPKAIRERCEITAPPTIEELRKIVGGYIGIVHGFTSIDIYGDGLAMPCVAFCNEDGKRLDLPVNWLATGMWHDALVRKGSRFGLLAEGGGYEDYLVGVIVVTSYSSDYPDSPASRRMNGRASRDAWRGSHGPAAAMRSAAGARHAPGRAPFPRR